ncbi:MAG TPA: glycosyltransferase family 4 protein [Vicinamibacterales bacterium]
MSTPRIRSIAMIDSDGGDGIGGYTYELAEGLVANGVEVDVYANGREPVLPLRRRHRVLPVLGQSLFGRRRLSGGSRRVSESSEPTERPTAPRRRGWRSAIRKRLLPLELALHLKRKRYAFVWVQWSGDVYDNEFYAWCKRFGMPVVHTVHNILPHEERPEDIAAVSGLYDGADALVVHSYAARDELLLRFPTVTSKTIVSRIGLYTMFPQSGARQASRQQLGLEENEPLVLFFGGIRPYKNIDAVLAALATPALRNARLVVAGRETGYANQIPGDPLSRTRRIARELGISERTCLVPGRLDLADTSALFSAADILALPYAKSYGSASLLLGMSFGKHIVATKTGGMDEYLATYQRHTLLDGCDAQSVATGLTHAVNQLRMCRSEPEADMAEFQWPNIAKGLLGQLGHLLS